MDAVAVKLQSNTMESDDADRRSPETGGSIHDQTLVEPRRRSFARGGHDVNISMPFHRIDGA